MAVARDGVYIVSEPVLDQDYSVSENSLIGYGRSVIVENNYLCIALSHLSIQILASTRGWSASM